MHTKGITIIMFVIGALLLGALLKSIMRNSKLPYTVVLLLVGIGLAAMDRAGWFGSGAVDNAFGQIGAIDPHLILFLFLPTLIFESAYGMESHLFFRIAPQITLLAVAGLIISMLLTAVAASWLLPWGFGVALLFGALISATDPVAVVALLKEKSSRKRLETLVEGESLLNDGTAIVFFSLFYGFAVRTTTTVQPLPVIGEFIWVVSLGLFVGIAVGWLTLQVIGRLFNQPLVEITLTIGAAYVTFFIAESFHVSGVVALVALALAFSTWGKTRISPEVSHFLHKFWEMMAYMANTLIFLIVGIVIALHVTWDSPQLWLTLGLLYLLLIVIRGISVWSLSPILKRVGVGFTKEKGAVLVWGGLRGAISLSLALSLAQDDAVPALLRDQILFLTAGIVVLTIVINGSTIEWLLHLLSLDKLPPAKEASVQKAKASINGEMSEFLSRFRTNPFFDKVKMEHLDQLIDDPCHDGSCSVKLQTEDIDVAFMRRLLEIERSDYWRQFEEGHIGRQAAYQLSNSVEQALDNKPVIAPRNQLNDIFTVPVPPEWIRKMPMMGHSVDDWVFSRLSLGYDIARGFVEAQEQMRRHIAPLAPNKESADWVESMLDLNCIQAFNFTRHVSEHYPDLVTSLQTRSAKRLLLNHQRTLIWKMQHNGVLEEAEAQHLIDEIERQMASMRDEEED
jgi:NhaP-type Na+/H+ or K+/H+ antiporter